MKQLSVLFCCIFLFLCTIFSCAATYNYTEDPVTNPSERHIMELVQQYALESTNNALSNVCVSPADPLDGAVRTYPLSSESFLNQYADGSFKRSEIDDTYRWELPIYLDGETGSYKYATFGYLEDGTFDYVITSLPADNFDMQHYLFHPDETIELLYEAGASDSSDIYVISIAELYLNIVVAEYEDGFIAIPYAARPDFLKVKNGVPTSIESVADTISTYIQAQQDSNKGGVATGGGILDSSRSSHTGIAAVVILSGAMGIFCYLKTKHSKTHKEK